MTETDHVSYSAKLKRPEFLRIGVVVAAGLVLLVSAAVATASSPSPTASPSAGTSQGAQPVGPGWGRFGGAAGGFGMGGGLGLPGFRGDGFAKHGFGQISIAAIDGSNLSLKTDDGWTRTITVTGSTTIAKGGQTIALGDLKVGDTIRFSETRNNDGSFTIDRIEVVLPLVVGNVTAVSDGGFTVNGRDGASWTITVTSATTFQLGKQTASKSDVKVGDEVAVEGTKGSGNSMTASAVRIEPLVVVGQVTARAGSTITVKRFDGTTIAVHVSGATAYQEPGVTTPGLSNVAVGTMVAVQGTQNPDGSFDATVVGIGPGKGMWQWGMRGGPRLPFFPGPTSSSAPQG